MATLTTQSLTNKKYDIPITPPGESSPAILATAQTVLRAQAQALDYISNLYESDESTKRQFFLCLQYMHNATFSHGKIVITGMGKSFKIAEKLVATLNSLGAHAASLHPSDALHGDLGVIKPADVIMMITASGNTPELLTLLPHLPAGIPLLVLTNTPDSPLAAQAAGVLSAEIPNSLSERQVYGLPAPTTSTTACLAVGDAVCITLAEMLVADVKERSHNFSRWHPGGAIGNQYQKEKNSSAGVTSVDEFTKSQRLELIKSRVVKWTRVGHISHETFASELELLRKCAMMDWVFIDSRYLVSTRSIFDKLESIHTSGSDDITNTRSIVKTLKTYDVFKVHKHSDNQLASLDMSLKLALLVDKEGTYSGLYFNDE